MVKRGVSLICPRDWYKAREPSKNWKPNVRFKFHQNTAADWGLNTLTSVSIAGSTLALSMGAVSGTATTYCINPTGFYPTDATKAEGRRDVREIILNWEAANNGGTILFYVSNDGGEHWSPVVEKNILYHLRAIEQAKYWDLRLQARFSRKWPGLASPVLTMWTVTFDLKGLRNNLD